MNSIQACFLLGLAIGLILAGVGTYKWEEDKILSLQNAQQKALIDAQNKSSKKEHQGADISTKVEKAYENAINTSYDNGLHNDPNSTKQLSKVSKPSGLVDGTCRLAKTRLNYLQEWIREEVDAFNK